MTSGEDFERGWEPYPTGTRVQVRMGRRWRSGIVNNGFEINERGIDVLLDRGHQQVAVMVRQRLRKTIEAGIRLEGKGLRGLMRRLISKI